MNALSRLVLARYRAAWLLVLVRSARERKRNLKVSQRRRKTERIQNLINSATRFVGNGIIRGWAAAGRYAGRGRHQAPVPPWGRCFFLKTRVLAKSVSSRNSSLETKPRNGGEGGRGMFLAGSLAPVQSGTDKPGHPWITREGMRVKSIAIWLSCPVSSAQACPGSGSVQLGFFPPHILLLLPAS